MTDPTSGWSSLPAGVRPMAWFDVPRKGDASKGQYPGWVPHTYAYPNPVVIDGAPEVWKHTPKGDQE